jgi:hypothetical protein
MNELADAIRSGDAESRFTVRRVKVVAGPPEVSAADIKAIRESIGVSQPLFAEFLGVPPRWSRYGSRASAGPSAPSAGCCPTCETTRGTGGNRSAKRSPPDS